MFNNVLLTFLNYQGGVRHPCFPPNPVTLMLHDRQGRPWPLSLSADCLRFIGRYRRIDGFDIDAALLFQGVRKLG